MRSGRRSQTPTAEGIAKQKGTTKEAHAGAEEKATRPAQTGKKRLEMRRFLFFTLFRRFYGNSYCPSRSSCANTAHSDVFSDFLPLFLFLFAL